MGIIFTVMLSRYIMTLAQNVTIAPPNEFKNETFGLNFYLVSGGLLAAA